MEGLSATKKGIMVQAILDIANATPDQILSRNFPQTQFPIRSRIIYVNANRSQYLDVRFTYMHNQVRIVGVFTNP